MISKPYSHLLKSSVTLEDDSLSEFIGALQAMRDSRRPPEPTAQPRKFYGCVWACAMVRSQTEAVAVSAEAAKAAMIEQARSGDLIWVYDGLLIEPEFEVDSIQRA